MKIADFGIAKLMGPERSGHSSVCRGRANGTGAQPSAERTPLRHSLPATNLTAAGQVMGTPQYMAPEQVEHPQQVDHRADIYSLGVVFYQMLTGELPIGRFAPPSKKVQIDVRLDEVGAACAGKRARSPLSAGQRTKDPRGDDRHHALARRQRQKCR